MWSTGSSSESAVPALIPALSRILRAVLGSPFSRMWHWLQGKQHVRHDPARQLVVITGCDSGFGYESAIKFAERGYLVVAACLTSDGVKSLHGKVAISIQCDVTQDSSRALLLQAVQSYLTAHPTTRLWAIVNNAGVAPAGFMDWISDSSIRRAMEVNYFAPVSIIKLFLPMLKKTKGSRIVNVSSVAGFCSIPNGGAYCASKHALEGMSRCLRQELAPWSIFVANINPGFMK